MSNKFKHAIVRKPCQNMVNGLSRSGLGKPNFELAQKQHKQYIEALETCDLKVEVLEADEDYPDSCFVEDVALCTPNCTIITRPGAQSRRGETEDMKNILEKYYQNIEHISSPGTLEAGDIMMVDNHYYIGLSERTNKEGANQMISILKKYGMTASVVSLEKVLHLKTGVAYLESNYMVVCGEFITKPDFQKYKLMEIPSEEAYAANCIWVNGKVIIPSGFPLAKQAISNAGYPIIELNMSEFQKLDGGLSCLSLRF